MSEPEPETTEPETEETPLEPEPVEEEAEEEEAADPGPEPEPEPSELEMEAAAKKSQTAWKRYSSTIAGHWDGTGAELRECPLCLDQHKGFVDLRFAGHYPKEMVDAIQTYLGVSVERSYKQSGKHNACTFCDAEGKVSTGSNVPKFRSVPCPECKGFGYTPPPSAGGQAAGNGAGDASSVPYDPPSPADDLTHGDVDEFGEPTFLPDGRENPNYGKRPAYKVQVEPWGTTANLTAQSAG